MRSLTVASARRLRSLTMPGIEAWPNRSDGLLAQGTQALILLSTLVRVEGPRPEPASTPTRCTMQKGRRPDRVFLRCICTQYRADLRRAARMNAAVLPEVLLRPQPEGQPALPLAAEDVQRSVWQSAFGPMLIDVKDGAAFVNGFRITTMDELRAGLATA